MNSNFKSGFVGIIGQPNVGKSTLLNNILKQHLAIVSPKAQTTRNQIKGIYTTDNEQIVFVDTPGIHKAHHELGNFMNETANNALDGLDLVLFMVDGSKLPSDADLEALKVASKAKCPVFLVLNKIDLVKNEEFLKNSIEEYKKLYNFKGGITITAVSDESTNKLLNMVIDNLPEGPLYYPEDQALDAPEKFVVAEIIREKILLLTSEEVPHSVAVVVESFKENAKHPNMYDILATIIVERPSQKKIIIGSGGSMIKKIGSLARIDIVKLLDKKVYLELFVKVESNWRNDKSQLKELGYKIQK